MLFISLSNASVSNSVRLFFVFVNVIGATNSLKQLAEPLVLVDVLWLTKSLLEV